MAQTLIEPGAQIDARHFSVMQHRPFQRERLPRRQAAFAAPLLFEFLAFAAFAESRFRSFRTGEFNCT